jgi:S-formylglutathione hydrolase FrmB
MPLTLARQKLALASRSSARFLTLAATFLILALLPGSMPIQASRIDRLTIDSEALGRKLAVSVYVPGAHAPAGGFPVLYLLHGLGGCETDWVALGGVQATLDRLIEQGRIRPMMVVMPGAGSSWYVDSGRVGGPGNFESAIGDDLPKAIEASYPAAEAAQLRAIAGVSMGGYGALRIALSRPEAYAAVASMSGALWQNLPLADASANGVSYTTYRDQVYYRRLDGATIASGVDLPPEGAHFGKAFGVPFDPKRFNAANVFTILAKQIKRGVGLPAIFLTVGDHDSHNLWRGSIALYQTLQAERQPVDFRVTDGDHTWALWRKSIEDTLIFVDGHFRRGSGAGGTVADSGTKAAS